MEEATRPTLLCVDDERHVLESMGLFLRRRYELLTAESGAEGIRLLRAHPEVCVIMSDMRMPGMDGATFLHAARSIAPDAPRLLLTGHADIESAITAINDGRIFRFLLKPSPPAQVLEAFEAALSQYRLVTAERELLEHTLRGAVKALSDVLSLAQPAAFGHALRVKLLAGELAGALLPAHRWAVEVAAMLAPLGSIALPAEVADKMHEGRALSIEEKVMVARVPRVTDSLLCNVPRLGMVRGMLALLDHDQLPSGLLLSAEQRRAAERGAAILRAAVDLDALDALGFPPADALEALRSGSGRYDPDVVAALETVRNSGGSLREVQEIPLAALRVGMVIAADVRLATGALFVARGYEVTTSLLERIRNLRSGAVTAPVRVFTVAPA